MDLGIGKVISELRKRNNITQEQLANAVGVSVPAVSKWENGNSYPDITLLIPIARFLEVTVDELMNYECDLTDGRVDEVVKQCTEKFMSDGFDAGLEHCLRYLKEYPKNLYLKFQISGLLPWFSAKQNVNEENVRRAEEMTVRLLKESSGSTNEQLRDKSRYMLACAYIQMKKYGEAEEILESLPRNSLDPNKLLPTVYLRQGLTAKAIKLRQQCLLDDFNSVSMSLSLLANIYIIDGRTQDALLCADAQRRLIEALELGDYALSGNSFLFVRIYSGIKDAGNTLLYLKQYLSGCLEKTDKRHLSDSFFFSTIESKDFPVDPNMIRPTVIRFCEELSDLVFIREDPRFKTLLEDFRKERL